MLFPDRLRGRRGLGSAVQLLGALDEPMRTSALSDLLLHPNPAAAQAAAATVAVCGSPQAIPALARAALTYPDAQVRRQALHALSQFSGSTVARVVAGAMTEDSDRRVRRAAARAAASHPDPALAERYSHALRMRDAAVRAPAAAALGALATPAAAHELMRALTSIPGWRRRLRQANVAALQACGQAAHPVLWAAGNAPQRHVRRTAARLLLDAHPRRPTRVPAPGRSTPPTVTPAWVFARRRRALAVARQLSALFGASAADALMMRLRRDLDERDLRKADD